MNSNKQLLQRIKNAVHEVEPKATIILYGSRARGDNKPDSDWDILIIVNKKKVSNQFEDEITFPLYKIEWDTGNIISPIVINKNTWQNQNQNYVPPFFESIQKEGILL